jgi:hypothetical protein
MYNDVIGKKKVIKKPRKNVFVSTRDNSTDPPLVTWDQDKKKIRLSKEGPSKKDRS